MFFNISTKTKTINYFPGNNDEPRQEVWHYWRNLVLLMKGDTPSPKECPHREGCSVTLGMWWRNIPNRQVNSDYLYET